MTDPLSSLSAPVAGPSGPVAPGRPRNALLERQARRESNARTYPRRIPLVVTKADGVHVWDSTGTRYIDCLAGAGSVPLGHNHPVLLEALRAVLDSGVPLHTLDLTTPIKDEFVTELFDALPAELGRHGRIQFCGPTGADGVEAALKLVKTATGRRSVVAFHGAYHGMSSGALGVTGAVAPKEAVPGLGADVHFMPYPYEYRSPFGRGPEVARLCAAYTESVLHDPESGIVPPAGMILEVVQGEGGVIPAPAPWVSSMRRITAELGIPLIVDEVQTGLGRTGHLWGFQEAGIVPDVVVLSKAVGGSLPMSVVVYRDELDVWAPGAHAGTFRGNQLAMAAGIATIRFVREEGLVERAGEAGARLQAGLAALAGDHESVGDVRGRGLMVGVEIVDASAGTDHTGSPPPDGAHALEVQRQLLDRGVIAELGGRGGAVVRFLPPLVITDDEIDTVVAAFGDALTASRPGRAAGRSR